MPCGEVTSSKRVRHKHTTPIIIVSKRNMGRKISLSPSFPGRSRIRNDNIQIHATSIPYCVSAGILCSNDGRYTLSEEEDSLPICISWLLSHLLGPAQYKGRFYYTGRFIDTSR